MEKIKKKSRRECTEAMRIKEAKYDSVKYESNPIAFILSDLLNAHGREMILY